MPSPEAPDSLSATTCEQCREQHLRCDRVLPICGRCLMTGRECKKGYKFRAPKHAVFRESHKWPAPPKRLKFIDETRGVELADDVDSNDSLHDSAEAEAEAEDASTSPGTTTVVDSTASDDRPSLQAAKAASWPLLDENHREGHREAHRGSHHGSHHGGGDAVVDEPVDPLPTPTQTSLGTFGADHLGHRAEQREHSDSVVTLPPMQSVLPPFEGIYTDRPVWPLNGRQEATLFRHYVDKLGFWLDLCDPARHFETEVPQRAGSCPILLNAIFALAARHLSLTSAYDSLASNRYHEQCLNYLIPLLDHAATVSDENLFAATIILRVLEEIDVNTLGQDTHGHLLGIHAFVNAGDRFLMPGTLTAACFWAGLRQEIYSAVINQQVVRMNLGHAIVDRSTTPGDDFVWSNRAIVHCADVLNFCFGSEAGSVLQWGQLEMANREWKNALPPSYTPIFFRERSEEEAFPEVWYQKACHIIAVQHHILAEMYLALFNPSIPRVGGGRKAAEKRLTEQIQELLRSLCGIGMCNQWSPPAMFTACMGIAIAGDRFDNRHDQEALLKMLSITEKAHARPTTAVRDQLISAWGWMDKDVMSET
ncbi:Putative zn(2)Cys(6) fungal-type DNA-binding domain, fungal transcription factor [Colletotrichum destructivum]|uniref:Zn(2)Cys(6) fungal-type DNA-binding domain, fungal transcription factor n=1 Tax=Colletotrichum destructivum TaxID=34406 RepID=A0AAX4IBI5_9PEZI|nr:Putative zn(2)Cys(6) fungal-type DNA-binding domain, fungal transcription factor [Colletotrichum destructivum]